MATIKDVAKEAGVSIGVVSKAFNNYPDISEKTKQRIFEVAKELNYSPNLVARNLSSKKQNTIGMITSGFFDSGVKDNNNSFQLFKGVYTAVEQNQYELAIYLIDSLKQKQKSYAQFCKERNIGGAVLAGIRIDDPYFKELIDTKIPCVILDVKTGNESEFIGSVSINNRAASKDIARYLLNRNHREIVVVTGKKETWVNVERTAGVKEAMDEYGLELKDENILPASFSENEAYLLTKELLETRKPTAFLCFSDLMALGVMKAVKEAGLRIPEDVSVTGFDGILISEFSQPGLTTIEQNFFEMGKQAALLLQQLMEGTSSERNIYVDYQLVERNSVGSVPVTTRFLSNKKV
ncbi:LacI family DNA-binding transcriptional regulator [Neobacillus vireti]|uniref:LacI family DNA-binding transcriptional regulator n=1 Tax=Neobacillus vireti TaxID=220686 RepID=UPI00054E06D8|nr:LacI family DNA-binding transcriptional regulator [Neobacillus vireti]KLT16593.1 transcriptional regulator [Neobacillus vireti]